MYEVLVEKIESMIYVPAEGMVHPGLSPGWVLLIIAAMLMIGVRTTFFSIAATGSRKSISVSQLPAIGRLIDSILTRPWLLVLLRIISAAIFLLVIYAGLFGNPIPERNIATVITWTVWWSGVVISVFFIGSAWCAVCPWDALATWVVRRKLWKRGDVTSSLNLRVPRILRSIWPALIMFIVLTWLELGMGITTSPYATALLALLMVVLATISLAVYERKAFCRYFCAVGRTLGAYGSMSPVALRPINVQTCVDCKTLECYHGTKEIEPCPTHLVLGRIKQNTYCTSCGACALSCPRQNVSWRLRRVGNEVMHASRPHWDEAWFILGLVALTIFHGFTMMPYWEDWMRQLAYILGDSGQLLISFSVGMIFSMLIPVLFFLFCIKLTQWFAGNREEFRRIFSALALSILPLAFTYHIAHNMSHLVREGHGLWNVILNPLGLGEQPLSMHEIHIRHMNPLIADNIVFAIQGMLVLFGFWLALRIARQRASNLESSSDIKSFSIFPIFIFITSISLTNLWLLMQPMVMRM